jgi:cation diffusion facilitator CzcD-associated flavoprotein CzcO
MGRPSIGIIGAGLGGIAAVIALKEAGYQDIVVFEKGDDVGGVWRANTYPGAACDVPSPFYSYSFAPNPDWPNRFAGQPAILDYIHRVADE